MRAEVAGHIGLTRLPPDRQEEKKPADWGEVFTIFLAHTNMSYEEIGERTIPQLEAIIEHLGRHICWKAGVPVKEESETQERKEHTVEDALAFCALFSGIA